jgi:hypothetical protein
LEYITAIWYILRPFGSLVAIWYIFPHFGIVCQEKSGNPDVPFADSISRPKCSKGETMCMYVQQDNF